MEEYLNFQKQSMDILGFWDDVSKKILIHSLETRYKDEILKEWCITDIVPNGDQFLFKWSKRFLPLTDEEIKLKYR